MKIKKQKAKKGVPQHENLNLKNYKHHLEATEL